MNTCKICNSILMRDATDNICRDCYIERILRGEDKK